MNSTGLGIEKPKHDLGWPSLVPLFRDNMIYINWMLFVNAFMHNISDPDLVMVITNMDWIHEMLLIQMNEDETTKLLAQASEAFGNALGGKT